MRADSGLQADGYAIAEGALPPAEIDCLASALGPLCSRRGRGGARHLAAHPATATIASDPRLQRLAAGILGPGARCYRATLLAKRPEANWLVTWHQDTALPLRKRFDEPGWGPWSVKSGIVYAHAPAWALERIVALRLHLDDSREDNGPLRVLPGSHRLGLLEDEEVRAVALEHPSQTVTVSRGGVLIMRPLLIHASSKAVAPENPRRVLHLEYAPSLELAPGIVLAIA